LSARDARAVLLTADAGTLGVVKDTGAGNGILAVIGVFKLVKTAVLLTLGIGALTGGHEDVVQVLAHFARWTGAFSGREIVQRALARLLALDNHTIHRLGVASLVYAVMFAVEGLGLLAKRTWAEWLTVGVTGSFIPLEAYELWHHPGPAKIVAIVLNFVIVAYLVWRRLEARR
jgi:uncharacterized membrane protein (DUF2068 family)